MRESVTHALPAPAIPALLAHIGAKFVTFMRRTLYWPSENANTGKPGGMHDRGNREQRNICRVQGGDDDVIDVAVIGAGPAGLTAGLYAARAGLNVVLFERISPGGQLAQTEHMENYPGFPEGANGFELAFAMKQQADRFGASNVGEEVVSVDFNQRGRRSTSTAPRA